VFEWFTEPSRQQVVLAQHESRVLQHDYVGTEHLLIASSEVDERLTAALARLGITTASARAQVARMVAPTGTDSIEGSFTPEATRALEGSRRESLQLGHDRVAPAHIVLGLLSVHDGTMPVLLTRLAVNPETLRASMVAVADGAPAPAVERPAALVPLCPRCETSLPGKLAIVTVDAGAERVRLVCCASCGTVVPALPGGEPPGVRA
jgi:ATP-dependent Clp protease ATP-binding subunit ClpA